MVVLCPVCTVLVLSRSSGAVRLGSTRRDVGSYIEYLHYASTCLTSVFPILRGPADYGGYVVL